MATIASLSVQLSASPAGMVAGLNTAKAAIASTAAAAQSFAGRIASSMASIGNQVLSGDFAGALRTGIQTALTAISGFSAKIPFVGPLLSAAFGAAIPVVESLISGVQKAISVFHEGAAKILEIRTASIVLGSSFQEAGALALAAGGDVERITRAMSHLNSTIQSARTGDAGALGALAGRLKLNPEALAQMGNVERLEAVKNGLAGINDELTKNALGVAVFGERAELAFGALFKSGNDLQMFRDQLKRFGLDLGATSMAEAKALANQVLEAKRSLNQINLAWEGFKANIAVGLAPIITEVVKLFGSVGVSAKDVQQIVVTGAKWMAMGGAAVIESWKGLRTVWDFLVAGFEGMIALFLKGLEKLLSVLEQLPGDVGASFHEMNESVRRGLKSVVKDIDQRFKGIDQRWAGPSAFQKVTAFFDGLERDLATKKKAIEDIEKNKSNYEPLPVKPQLAGAAGFGSQEAYKTIGNVAAQQNATVAQRQLTQQEKLNALVSKGLMTWKDIRGLLKKGVVKVGKIG